MCSVVVEHGLNCFAACVIFPDQGLNLCPLHWQEGYHPQHHQGSPLVLTFILKIVLIYTCRRLSVKELMLLNCGAGEDSWELLGHQRDQISQS